MAVVPFLGDEVFANAFTVEAKSAPNRVVAANSVRHAPTRRIIAEDERRDLPLTNER